MLRERNVASLSVRQLLPLCQLATNLPNESGSRVNYSMYIVNMFHEVTGTRVVIVLGNGLPLYVITLSEFYLAPATPPCLAEDLAIFPHD